MEKTILITGGAGYIGSITTRLLLDNGYSVVIVDNLSHGNKSSIPGNAQFYKADLLDKKALAKVFRREKPHAVIHFASLIEAGTSMNVPLEYYENNILSTVNLLNAMKGSGTGSIVFSSSAAVYGMPKSKLIKEDDGKQPVNHYGWTKLMNETIIDSARVYGIRNIALRYFNAAGAGFGLGESHNPETHLIPAVLDVAIGKRPEFKVFGNDYKTKDGTPVRDYIHVLDLASAHLLALQALDQGKEGKYNVGIGKGYSVVEVVEHCRKITGKPIPLVYGERRAGDPPILVASSDKLKKELGWQPKFGIEEILESAWEWHKTRSR